MKVLMIDANPFLDQAALLQLRLRGYEIQTVPDAKSALELATHRVFDCSVVGIPGRVAGEPDTLAVIRQLARRFTVALMTAVSTTAIIEEALDAGSLQVEPSETWTRRLNDLPLPSLVVVSELDPSWVPAIRDRGIVAVPANSLPFALNLLADGWCEVVLLKADIPHLTRDSSVVIFHHFEAHLLAVLASVRSATPSGIVHWTRPTTVDEFIELVEQTAEHRLNHCGLAEAGTR